MAGHQAPVTAGAIYTAIASLTPAQQAMLTEISKHTEPVTVAELAGRLDLHPNSVRVTLDSLSKLRLIDRQVLKRGGRGRPCWGYYTLAPDTNSFACAQMIELVGVFCDALRHVSKDPIADSRRVGHKWGDRILKQLAEESRGEISGENVDVDAQISQLRVLYTSLGTSATINAENSREIDLHSCPFVNRDGQVDPLICEMHAGFVERVMESNCDSTLVGELHPMERPGVCKIAIGAASS